MRFLPLVIAGLWRKPARTVFTFLSIVVAFILFGVLTSIQAAFDHALESSRLDRLLVDTRYGTPLPLAYVNKVEQLPGVTVVAPRQILVGYFRDPHDRFGVVMTDPHKFFAVRPELTATPEQIEALAKNRAGALISVFAARKNGWKVGQKVPVIASLPRKDGGHVWTFDIVGVFDDADWPGQNRWFVGNYDYVDQERAANQSTIDRMLVRIADPARSTQVSRQIDRLFANSPAPTRTGSEKSGAQSGVAALGNIAFFTGSVIMAVLFMMLFLTGNTMMQSVRERDAEFAVLKTMGYSDGTVLALVLGEAVLLCLAAAAAGLLLSSVGVPYFQKVSPELGRNLWLSWPALGIGLVMSLGVGFVAAAVPALRAKRLTIVDALTGR
jgi:putative ABC transport system permease protein